MYLNVSNRILLSLQMIPSKNLALKKTTDSLRRKEILGKFIKIFCVGLGINFRGNLFSLQFFFSE